MGNSGFFLLFLYEWRVSMATILSMPKWGLAMKTGRVVEWLKHPGDAVQQGEPIAEIESEKAVNEVEAPASGIVRLLVVEEGDSTAVSEPLAVIAAQGEELSDEQVATLLREDAETRRQQAEALTKKRDTAKTAATAAGGGTRVARSEGERVQASPAARRLAQELGVDLTTLVGTGPKGMIGREDVLRAAEEARAASSEESEERTINVDGVAVHCLLAGPTNAPHIVFVHGLGGSLTTWALNLPAFAARFRICALDLVGTGESDKPEMPYSVNALADFLARFLQALGPDWQHVNLVGHSLGGAIALDFAGRYAEQVERLVLVDSVGLGKEVDEAFLQLVHREPTPEHIQAELACFFANADLVQPALVEQVYQQRRQPGAREALLATADAAFRDGQQQIDLRSTLSGCEKPVLLIWGAADEILPVAHAQAAAAPRIQITVFADCAHCPHIESSDRFNEVVMQFLSEA
jgi:pyruvate dehydrogenase E2 component (dihydrolipoamide acetyltransferase)